jgi:hypothetical protein
LESSTLFANAVAYLGEIKDISSPFDLSKIEFYKRLQGTKPEEEGEVVSTIEIEAPDAASLAGTAVTVFGTVPQELRQLGALRNVHLHAFDEAGSGQHVYRAKVMHSGLMPNYTNAAAGLSLGPRRYAFRAGERFPKLMATSAISGDVLENAAHFVVLDVEEYEHGVQAFDLPRRLDPWKRMEAALSPLLRRLNPDQQKALFGGRAPVIREPASPGEAEPKLALLDDRRALSRHRFVIKKLLRRS